MNHDGAGDCACGAKVDPCCTAASRNVTVTPRITTGQDTKPEPETRPFVAQDGQFLYLVASATRGWVVAELEFDPASCVFVLKRQTEYEWPREALGRLLSRVLSPHAVDDREMHRMSRAFTDWLATQFVA